MRFNLKKSGPLIGGGLLLLAAGLTLPAFAIPNGGTDGGASPSPSITATPSTAPSTEAPGGNGSGAECASDIKYLALTSDNKESKYANGNPVTVNEDDSKSQQRTAIINAIQRYVYQDPAGASELVTAFRPEMNWSSVNNRLQAYVGHHDAWCNDVDAMLDTVRSASFSIKSVDAGMWSLYQVPTGDDTVPVKIKQGTTSEDGTAAVFTMDGRTVMLRLDCHFQPVRTSKFPGVPVIPGTPKSSASPSPSGSSSQPSSGPSLAPKKASQDPARQGHAKQGGGTNTGTGTYVPPSDAPTPPSDGRTNPPAPAASASPAPSDGTNNGCVTAPGGPAC